MNHHTVDGHVHHLIFLALVVRLHPGPFLDYRLLELRRGAERDRHGKQGEGGGQHMLPGHLMVLLWFKVAPASWGIVRGFYLLRQNIATGGVAA